MHKQPNHTYWELLPVDGCKINGRVLLALREYGDTHIVLGNLPVGYLGRVPRHVQKQRQVLELDVVEQNRVCVHGNR